MLDGEFLSELGTFETNTSIPDIMGLVTAPFIDSMGAPIFYSLLIVTSLAFVYFKTQNITLPIVMLIMLASIWINAVIPEISGMIALIITLVLSSIIYYLYSKKSH